MKLNKKLFSAIALLFLFSTTIVFAASSSDYFSNAKKYIDRECGKRDISNQISLHCYLFYKTTELNTRVTTLENPTPPVDSDFIVNVANTSIQQSNSGNPNDWLPRFEVRPTWKGRQIDQDVDIHGTWHTSSGGVLFVVNGGFNFPQHFLQPIDASTPVTIPVDITVVWQNYTKTISTTITVPN